MRLTTEQVRDLLKEHFPRHVNDMMVQRFTGDRAPDDTVIIITDSVLWDNADAGTMMAMSMSTRMAHQMYTQLGQVLDHIHGGEL